MSSVVVCLSMILSDITPTYKLMKLHSQAASRVMMIISDKWAQTAIRRKRADNEKWASVHRTCCLMMVGLICAFGQHREQDVGNFNVESIRIIEKMAAPSNLKELMNFPFANVEELAMRM